MGWFGKLIGGTIGFALGGPLGAILGTTFGHAFDSKNETDNRYKKTLLSSGEQAQLTFFVATFSMLAKLVKVDKSISKEEIDSIEKFMLHDLGLNPESRRIAMNIFHTAMDSQGTFRDFAAQFYEEFQSQPQLLDLMIDILLRVSVADGFLSEDEENLILSAARTFKFTEEEYRKLKSKYVRNFEKYFAILKSKSSDSNDQIKK
ncbi:MAG: TerB family tellurite resistance protein, partial [Desulfobacterales bacterium]|nr:TerB family tellurite resistance protein [Desulfobacterales bacterium]